jgi:hypothetical protein
MFALGHQKQTFPACRHVMLQREVLGESLTLSNEIVVEV